MRNLAFSLLMLAILVRPGLADEYHFSITYNGSAATINPWSDPILNTFLGNGDTYVLDVHALPNDYWQVESSQPLGTYAVFLVRPSGTRWGNITTNFFNDGTLVAQDIDLGQPQSASHIGGSGLSLPVGLHFDQVVVNYELRAGTTSPRISSDGLWLNPFYDNTEAISYVYGAPEPGNTVLLLAVGALAIARRRRRQIVS